MPGFQQVLLGASDESANMHVKPGMVAEKLRFLKKKRHFKLNFSGYGNMGVGVGVTNPSSDLIQIVSLFINTKLQQSRKNAGTSGN